MRYFVNLAVSCTAEQIEMIQAELAMRGFDTFLDKNEESFETSTLEGEADTSDLEELASRYNFSYVQTRVEEENWNAIWESSFEPIVVSGQCVVRAEFHESFGNFPYEIVITPKMAFGTGHHETTRLVMEYLLAFPPYRKRVLDTGCGTAILGMLAHKMGADEVIGIDNDSNATENALANCALNATPMQIHLGTASILSESEKFDVVIANITREILIEEMPIYSRLLHIGGTLLLSGFYDTDVPMLIKAAQTHNLIFVGHKSLEEWAAIKLTKV
ncbi:MAG: 50S ribosomal protein L11 methyltransferase [Cytophagales bacterium]|nr:MAG: 50S ribosomal protein L11 methyltransferase [Cytophagales bacterium]TAF61162.1 MAG: 50S ribosomal protein L11 methyltransferase [Cytophagales bacterium]